MKKGDKVYCYKNCYINNSFLSLSEGKIYEIIESNINEFAIIDNSNSPHHMSHKFSKGFIKNLRKIKLEKLNESRR